MAITTLDQVISLLPGQPSTILKSSLTAKAAGTFQSFWTAGGLPSTGAATGSANGAIINSATAGALKINNPQGVNKLYIAKLGIGCSTSGLLIVYDRLWSNSTLNGTLLTAQTWVQPTLTRIISGDDVEAWIETYSPTGATAVTATLTYTNELGVAGRLATTSLVSSPVAGQMMPFSLAVGDNGIRSTSQVVLSATTGTVGNFGIVLMKRLLTIPISVTVTGAIFDAFGLGMPEVEANAAIAFAVLTSAANTGTLIGDMNIIEG